MIYPYRCTTADLLSLIRNPANSEVIAMMPDKYIPRVGIYRVRGRHIEAALIKATGPITWEKVPSIRTFRKNWNDQADKTWTILNVRPA